MNERIQSLVQQLTTYIKSALRQRILCSLSPRAVTCVGRMTGCAVRGGEGLVTLPTVILAFHLQGAPGPAEVTLSEAILWPPPSASPTRHPRPLPLTPAALFTPPSLQISPALRHSRLLPSPLLPLSRSAPPSATHVCCPLHSSLSPDQPRPLPLTSRLW